MTNGVMWHGNRTVGNYSLEPRECFMNGLLASIVLSLHNKSNSFSLKMRSGLKDYKIPHPKVTLSNSRAP